MYYNYGYNINATASIELHIESSRELTRDELEYVAENVTEITIPPHALEQALVASCGNNKERKEQFEYNTQLMEIDSYEMSVTTVDEVTEDE